MTEQIIPETVDEALAAWDRGDAVQAITIGGISEGYEMSCQCAMFEVLRALHDDPALAKVAMEQPAGERFPDAFLDALQAAAMEADKQQHLGLSSMQANAAKQMAISITRYGWDSVRSSHTADRLVFFRKLDPRGLHWKYKDDGALVEALG